MKDGISDPVEFISNRPMLSSEFEQVRGRGTFGCQTCDTLLNVAFDLPGAFTLLLCRVLINLLEPWPVGVFRQECACGEGACGKPQLWIVMAQGKYNNF